MKPKRYWDGDGKIEKIEFEGEMSVMRESTSDDAYVWICDVDLGTAVLTLLGEDEEELVQKYGKWRVTFEKVEDSE